MSTAKERVEKAMSLSRPDSIPIMCQMANGHTIINTEVHPIDYFTSDEIWADCLLKMRELYDFHPEGISLDDLLKRYNAEKILRIRLDRFLGSGEIIQDGDVYRAGKHKYIFAVLETIAQFLQKVTNTSSKKV